ncbi:hypothetical protein PRZ48_014661 [Zasmidium cellare]|uniref:F-box domain-containing protein n=1 Tax=Zasmidium cellare TaxID=395010 RepID=A0ABR0DZE5_ZASCE|nr:hypothetical protein PRZ48_014661 [Zasmidium cellare]
MPPLNPTNDESSATERTLHTTELLEQILLNLDYQTLLLSQRVNRQFKGTIDGSLKLQKKLFFRLADEDEDEAVKYGDDGVNPLASKVPYLSVSTTSQEYIKSVRQEYPNLHITFYYPNPPPPPSSHTHTPSWRRMYLTPQPFNSNDEASVTADYESEEAIAGRSHSYVPKEPVVMGEYEAAARKALDFLLAEEKKVRAEEEKVRAERLRGYDLWAEGMGIAMGG